MSTIGLTPSAASGLDPAVVLLRDTQGFLYLPVFVESVLAASACLNYLQTHLSQQFYNLAWPIDELKTSLIGNLDDAINKLPRNSTIVLDASSKERHKLALEAAAYLNLRREPLRAAALRFIICWPIELKDELLAKAPDLWSMRALSPWVTKEELVFPESNAQNEIIFEDTSSNRRTTTKTSDSIEKKLAKWERHHNLKLADLSEHDAIYLSGYLIDNHQYKTAAEIAEAVIYAIDATYQSPTSINSWKADAHSLLSISLHKQGNINAALDAAKKADAIFEKLASINPVAFEPNLAMNVNNLANLLSETGDLAGALATAHEAVGIYRRLAAATPVTYEPDLAMSINNLANRLSETGDRTGALMAAQEAVTIYRRLAAENPNAFELDLSMSLNNMASFLRRTGNPDHALQIALEAVAIRKRMVVANPAIFEPALASSVNNLANILSETGDRAGALLAAQEAVDIRRRLVAANPAAFEPDLASSVNNLANILSETGDRTGALLAAQEAVDIRRRLAAANPAAFEPDLAMSVNNLAVRLSESGDRAVALAAAKEALALFESSNTRHTGLFENQIAHAQKLIAQLEDLKST